MGAKTFKAYNGEYIVAEEGHIYLHHHKDHKAVFHVEEHDGGAKVSLKTHNGHYVAVNTNKEIYVAHQHSGDESKWHLEHHHGKIALKSHHGGYLGVDPASGKIRVHHEKTEYELFEEDKA